MTRADAAGSRSHWVGLWHDESGPVIGWRSPKGVPPRAASVAKRVAALRPDPTRVTLAAMARMAEVCAQLLPGGRTEGRWWRAPDPRGEGRPEVRVLIEGAGAGAWIVGDRESGGSDPLSLARTLTGERRGQATARLVRILRGSFPGG